MYKSHDFNRKKDSTSLIDVESFELLSMLIAKGTNLCLKALKYPGSHQHVVIVWRFQTACRVFTEEKPFKELYSLEKGAMLINYFRSQMSSFADFVTILYHYPAIKLVES